MDRARVVDRARVMDRVRVIDKAIKTMLDDEEQGLHFEIAED